MADLSILAGAPIWQVCAFLETVISSEFVAGLADDSPIRAITARIIVNFILAYAKLSEFNPT